MSLKKLLGDAGEHYALSMPSFAGRFTAKMPGNWKEYDLAVEDGGQLVRVSVKTRSQTDKWTPSSHYRFGINDKVEWFVFILKQKVGPVRAWVVPKSVAVQHVIATKTGANESTFCRIQFKQLKDGAFAPFEDNWALDQKPKRKS